MVDDDDDDEDDDDDDDDDDDNDDDDDDDLSGFQLGLDTLCAALWFLGLRLSQMMV